MRAGARWPARCWAARAMAGQSASRRTVRASCAGSRVEQRRLGEQHRRAGIRQHEGEPLGRVVRVERQIGAAGLEDAEQPDQHRQRALDAQPHHHLGPDAERAQVMRQLVRARVELAVAQPLAPRTPPRPPQACARPAPRTAPASVAAGDRARGVVPLPQDRAALRRRRGCRGGRSRARDRRPQPPAAARSRPRQRLDACRDRTGRWRIPAPPRSPPASRPPRAARRGQATGRTSRSPLRPAQTPRCRPGSVEARAGALFWNASITWNSGCRASERAGLSTSTSRSNGTSWWL